MLEIETVIHEVSFGTDTALPVNMRKDPTWSVVVCGWVGWMTKAPAMMG